MPANPAVQLHGMRDLLRAFSKADRDTKKGTRAVMSAIAQPVASTAEELAVQRITRIGPRWSKMRVGLTTRVLYVAPRQRGVRGGAGRRRRPNLAPLMMDRAMEPALEQHRPAFELALDRALDQICDRFNRGGPL